MLRSLKSSLFASSGVRASFKVVVLDSEESLSERPPSWLCSLNFIEHVSPATLMSPGISRPSTSRKLREVEFQLSIMRRWFWARKPDAGFLLYGFPATMLQALVFDEWLDTRNESLDAVIPAKNGLSVSPVSEHYQLSGVLMTLDQLLES